MIIQGIVVNHDQDLEEKIIEINPDTGLIEEVSNTTRGADIIIPPECYIFPGFGDIHVHLREDVTRKNIHKETFETGALAALNGGVTFVVDQANNPEAPTNSAKHEAKSELAKDSKVTMVMYAGIGPRTSPLDNQVPYKLFLGAISQGGPNPYVAELDFFDLETVDSTLKRYQGQRVSFHLELSSVLAESQNAPTHEDRRPAAAEIGATPFAIRMIKKHNLRGNVCHYSTKEGLALIVEARKQGVPITIETDPHHCYFDRSMLTDANRKFLQMNPPLRGREDRMAMIEALRDGTIDYLATDHAPHTVEEKEGGISGVPHLDTYGPFTTWLMKEHAFEPQDIARVSSYNPGWFVNDFLPEGHGKGFGRIAPGYMGSLTIIDPNKPVTISRDMLQTKCGWSPFEGITFPGSVKFTVVGGKSYQNAKPLDL